LKRVGDPFLNVVLKDVFLAREPVGKDDPLDPG
jgi:hypothetical protein